MPRVEGRGVRRKENFNDSHHQQEKLGINNGHRGGGEKTAALPQSSFDAVKKISTNSTRLFPSLPHASGLLPGVFGVYYLD